MQPEPIKTSTHILNPSNASEPTNAPQHGIRPEELHSADESDPLHEERVSADSSPAPSAIQANPTGDTRLQDELRRLSMGDRTDTRPKPSVQRISEYENALSPSPPRKQSEGPWFKIIKKKSDILDGPQLGAFPNGR
jgi:hypothetical protein